MFKGTVAADQPRLNAALTQNVVTYTVVINIDKTDARLLPYMSAHVQIVIAEPKTDGGEHDKKER